MILLLEKPISKVAVMVSLVGLIGLFGIAGCLYLFASLPSKTQIFFLGAQLIGLVLYAVYGHPRAEKARAAK